MRDSLDLEAIKLHLQKTKDKYRRLSLRLRFIFVVILIGTVLASVFQPSRSTPLVSRIVWLLIYLTFSLASLYQIIRIAIRFIRSRSYDRKEFERINRYAPVFVSRPRKRIYPWLIIFAAIILGLLLVIQFHPPWTVLGEAFPALMFTLLGYGLAQIGLVIWASRGGITRIEKVLRWFPNDHTLLQLKVANLMQQANTDTAAVPLHDLLSSGKLRSAASIGMVLNNMGYALTLDRQYPEALPILEAAIHIYPEASELYNSLALWYLDQNIEFERAIELSNIAIKFRTLVLQSRGKLTLLEAVNTRALILAGHTIQSEITLEKTLSKVNDLPPKVGAETNRQLGYIYLTLGDRDQARSYFERSASLDPQGIYGQLAQRALAEHFAVS